MLFAGNGPGSDIWTSVAVVVIVMPPGIAVGGDVGVALYEPGPSPSALDDREPAGEAGLGHDVASG